MLKTSSTKSVEPKKGIVIVGDGGRNKSQPIGKYEVDGDEVGGIEVNDKVDDEFGKNQKTFKSKNLFKSKKIVRSSDFLISGAKLAFIKLR